MGQDVIIDSSGTLRSRGGYVSATSDTFTTITPGSALQTSAGTLLVGRDSTGATLAFATSLANLTSFTKITASQLLTGGTAQNLTQQPSTYTFAKFDDNKGAILAADYGVIGFNLGNTSLWGGNIQLTSDTTTGTAASTIGSKSIAGVGTSWGSSLLDTYLFIGAGTGAIYVGQVATVNSTTSITLYKGALKTIAAAAPAFKTIRPMQYMVYKGRITTNTSSAVVVGSNTKWSSSGPAGGGSVFLTNTTSNLFRYSDGAFIGAISSVQNDNTITLGTNAAIALVNEEYYITNPTFFVSGSNGPVFLFYGGSTARFADRYWHGCFQAADAGVSGTSASGNLVKNMPNGVAFSKKGDPECLDLDPVAGDFIPISPSHQFDRIRGLVATKGGLVVFRTRDVWMITGYSPDTFRAVKILDDGVPMNLAYKEYREGVIWAGIKSVWYFDGTKIYDLLANTVDKFYQRTMSAGDINNPVCMAISNDYAIVTYPVNSGTDKTWPVGNTTGTLNRCNLVVNLLNGSVTFFTNLSVTNSFYSDALGSSIILARLGIGLSNTTGYLLLGNTIFTDSATAANNVDLVANTNLTGTSLGPNVLWETTKLTAGNGSLLKTWKRFLMLYSSDVAMTASIISNNNTTLAFPNTTTGTVSTDSIAASSGTSILHRMRFTARSPSLAVRIYQTSAPSAGVSQRFKCQWWSVGFKLMRAGRVQP